MRRSVYLAVLSLGLGGAAQAQLTALAAPQQVKEEGPHVVRLSLEATPEPRPALRYKLKPGVLDLKPGNAALAYKTAETQFLEALGDRDELRPVRNWLDAPAEAFPVERVKTFLDRFEPALHTLSRAARYEDCDWQLPVREEGFALLLPHLSGMRDMARVLALRARLHLLERRFDEALSDIRTGLSMARHIGNSSTLIEGLVGIAISEVMFDRVEELIDAPSSPSLYWALTELGSAPLVNLQEAMRWEHAMLYVHVPSLANLDHGGLTAEEYHRVLSEVVGLKDMAGGHDEARQEWLPMTGTALALAVYPRARRAMLEQGHGPEDVEAMSVAEAVMRYLVGGFEYHRDEIFKWTAVPFPEGRRGMVAAQLELKEAMAEDPIASFLPGLLLPATTHAAARFTKMDRRTDALRCIEALRLHADATGEGLPDTLAQVQVVPVPDDPLTGQPFAYQTTPTGARLDALAIPGDKPRQGRSYEITLKP